MKIQLTQNKITEIDDEDYDLVKDLKWYAAYFPSAKKWYVMASVPTGSRQNRRKIKLHRLIMGAKPGQQVDHIDGDTLNNRRSNLRICSNAQNAQNTGPRKGSSRFKGVSWMQSRKKWHVAFRCHGQYHFVGNFDDELEAAKAYNAAILPLAGEFAWLNPVSDLSENGFQMPEKLGKIWDSRTAERKRGNDVTAA